jgi:transcriptional accessory protein Tex/SPT6
MPVTIESRIAQELSANVQQVVAAVALLDEGATVRDIIAELEKPGRDPRPEFKTAEF